MGRFPLTRLLGGVSLVNASGTLIGLGLNIFLAREMGATGYGSYVYLLAWVNVLAIGATLGLDTSLLRFLPALRSISDWPALRGLLRFGPRVGLGVGTLLGLALFSGIWLAGDRIAPELLATAPIAAAVLPVLSLMFVARAATLALGRPVVALLPERLVEPTSLLLAVLAYSLFDPAPMGSPFVMGAKLLSTTLALAIGYILLARTVRAGVEPATPAYRPAAWIRTSLPLLAISGSQIVLARGDTLMLGMLDSPRSAGEYAVASRVAGLVTFFIAAANQIVAPRFSELHTKNNHAELQRLVTSAARLVFLISLPVVGLEILFGRQVLRLFGEGFTVGFVPLCILLVGQLVIVACGSVGFLMTMTDHHRPATVVIVGASIGNLVLNAILIPAYGIVGAALATTTVVSLRSLILSVLVRRRLGIMPTILGPELLRVSSGNRPGPDA